MTELKNKTTLRFWARLCALAGLAVLLLLTPANATGLPSPQPPSPPPQDKPPWEQAASPQGSLEDQVQRQLELLLQSQEGLPPQSEELLEELGLENLQLGELLSLTPQRFLGAVLQSVQRALSSPLVLLGRLVAILLLCGLMYGVKSSVFGGEMDAAFSVVSVLCTVSFLAQPIIGCITQTTQALRDCSLFILSFIPVFGGVVAAGGSPAAGGGYNLLLFGACQGVSQIAGDTLIPLMGVYFALCVVSSAVPQLQLDGVVSGIQSLVCWGLGVITTLFVGLLSLQSIVSTGADSLTMKTSKFLVGSFIPVIGGVLTDAMSAARGYLHLLKGAVGTVGILVAAATFLPVFIRVIVWYLVVTVGAHLGRMLQAGQVAGMLRGASSTLAVLLAAITCFALLIIVSTTVVMVFSGA